MDVSIPLHRLFGLVISFVLLGAIKTFLNIKLLKYTEKKVRSLAKTCKMGFYYARRPIFLSLVYFILLSLIAGIATFTIQVLQLSMFQAMILQGGCFLLSATLAVLIMSKSPFSLEIYGLRSLRGVNTKGLLWFTPLVLVGILPLVAGLDQDISVSHLLALAGSMLVFSINEELYFRGLILRVLMQKGIGVALVISSLFFGLAHLGSLVLGKSLGHTLALVTYSILFAFVCAQITLITRSLIVPIVWHFLHNFVSSIAVQASVGMTAVLVIIQSALLLGYAIYLWPAIPNRKLGDHSNENSRL